MKKTVHIFLSFFLSCLMIIPLKAQSTLRAIPIGKVQAAQQTLINDTLCIPLISVAEALYVLDQDLAQLGWQLQENDQYFELFPNFQSADALSNWMPDEQGQAIYCEPKPVYMGNVRGQLLRLGTHYYVPLTVLKQQWHLEEKGNEYLIRGERQNHYLRQIHLDEKGIMNTGDYWLALVCRHGFWQKSRIVWETEEILLAPGEKKNWQFSQEGFYLGTQIKEGNGISIPLEQQTQIQNQQPFYEAYEKAEKREALQKVFPPLTIAARMRYGIADLQAGQEVTLLRSEKHAYYWVADAEGHQRQVPFGSIQIIGERWQGLPKVTKDDLEAFPELMEINSETPYLIWTDLARQRTYVLEKQAGKWRHLKTFICSSGKIVNPTPPGLYQVEYAIPYFGMGKGFRCKYALVFYQEYMYHSILFDKTGQYVKSGQYELGNKASHGCVRLSEKDSHWLYEHIPVKTRVWIR